MVCAAPWKTCNCPWFNYQHMDEDDRLGDMRVPYAMPRDDVVEVVEIPEPASPPIRRSSTRVRNRPERELDRAEEILAAHLQDQLRLEARPTASEVHRSDPQVRVYGLGNSGGHHMNESYSVRPLATTAARTAVRMSAPRPSFFSRRLVRDPPRAVPRTVTASTMAGLSRDGSKRGANRVGTWLSHVEADHEAIQTAPRGVEVDDWRVEGSMIGID
jgi:ariadne-1